MDLFINGVVYIPAWHCICILHGVMFDLYLQHASYHILLQITKKLAGTARGTGLWLTSVGNEFGQVLISVLTAQEGAGLDMMVDGLVKRYQQAGVNPPAVLYVDCGCCTEVGETKLKTRFRGWPDLVIRLDIWHFMCRIAMATSLHL